MTPLSGPDDPDKFPAPQPLSVFAPSDRIQFVGSRLADDQNFILISIITLSESTFGIIPRKKYQL